MEVVTRLSNDGVDMDAIISEVCLSAYYFIIAPSCMMIRNILLKVSKFYVADLA